MLSVIFQFVTMVLVGALLFAVKKGFSEVIRGLESLDKRVERTGQP